MMGRFRTLPILGVVMTAAAIPAATAADGKPLFLAVGGGQLLVADSPSAGPGDTIAFSARQLSADGQAEGQVQEKNREAGTGLGSTFHGRVVCMTVDATERSAVIGYVPRQAPDGPARQLRINDLGEGPLDDTIIRSDAGPGDPCEPGGPTDPNSRLARGNVRIEEVP